MSIVRLVLEIPAEVMAKVATGEYVRAGGVIRDAAGRIVMHARDAGELEDVRKALPDGLSGGPALATLQLANTAVMAAGFAVMKASLDTIMRQCNEIIERAAATDRKISLLQVGVLHDKQSRMLAAMEAADTAHQRGEPVNPWDMEINHALLYFQGMVDMMVREGHAFRAPKLFTAFVQQSVVALLLRTQTQWFLHGTERALQALDQGIGAHDALVATLQRTLRQPLEAVPDLLDLDAGQVKAMKDMAVLLRLLARQLGRRRVELEAYIQCGLVGPPEPQIRKQWQNLPDAWVLLDPQVTVERGNAAAGQPSGAVGA